VIETEIDSETRAALYLLRSQGVPAADCLGVLRAGVIICAALEETAEARDFRAWLTRPDPAAPRVRPDPALARYLGTAKACVAVISAYWSRLTADSPPATALAEGWAACDRAAGELLLGHVPAWLAVP
jgi:hypothetical protein